MCLTGPIYDTELPCSRIHYGQFSSHVKRSRKMADGLRLAAILGLGFGVWCLEFPAPGAGATRNSLGAPRRNRPRTKQYRALGRQGFILCHRFPVTAPEFSPDTQEVGRCPDFRPWTCRIRPQAVSRQPLAVRLRPAAGSTRGYLRTGFRVEPDRVSDCRSG
jgi:hypothetical protein